MKNQSIMLASVVLSVTSLVVVDSCYSAAAEQHSRLPWRGVSRCVEA